jgi:hypothetical protein
MGVVLSDSMSLIQQDATAARAVHGMDGGVVGAIGQVALETANPDARCSEGETDGEKEETG